MKTTKGYLISSSGWVAHCVLQKQHHDLLVEQEALSRISFANSEQIMQ